MSSSYVTGSGSSAYVGLGGIFRTRLAASDNPTLKTLATQLSQTDKRSQALQEVINPKGFVGVDGKMKYIPGISFSSDSALFDSLKLGTEISDERMKQQIDGYARKRAAEDFNKQIAADRANAQKKLFETQRQARSKRQTAMLNANNAYLEAAFGINKKKTEKSSYSTVNNPIDSNIFGMRTGHSTDYINDYSSNGQLTANFPSTISYGLDSNTGTKQTIKISDYQYKVPNITPSNYVVRLTGNGKADNTAANGSILPSPSGKLTYTDTGGNLQTIRGSTVKELTQAELDSLEYVMDSSGTDIVENNSTKDGVDYTSSQSIKRQDFLSIMAVAPDPSNPSKMQRGYISKISLNRSDHKQIPSASGDKTYHSKLMFNRESYFTSVTLNASGTYLSDGNASTNANDGTLLDMINEGRVSIFAREIGYTSKLKIDTSLSSDNSIVLLKDTSKLFSDGVEFYITVKEADRNDIDITSLTMGLGKA